MPSSAVQTFSDPDEYAASTRATRAELTVTGRGRFTAKLIRIDLHRLWMQRHSEDLARIKHSANVAGRAIISFCTQPGPSLLWGGVELDPSTIVQHSQNQSHYQRSSGFTHYGSMSLPVADIVAVGAAMAGCDLTPPKDPLILTPPPLAMAKLQRLHAAAGRLAEKAPEIIANPDAARGLEQALVEAMISSLGGRQVREDSIARRQHAMIMRRFRRVVEEKPGESVYVTEICKLIRVSERTLEVCCQEQLGIGPKRYLVLRRLHRARQALREAAPDRTTVTDIATRYGFWHFGRFAGAYQSLFEELPTVTLHR